MAAEPVCLSSPQEVSLRDDDAAPMLGGRTTSLSR